MTVNEKIAKIRERMTENHIDAVIVPSADPHMSEYYSEHWKTRAWLSGFTGSAGSFVITQSVAGLWTDGRYYVQAEKQLSGSEGVLFKMNEPETPKIHEYLAKELPENAKIDLLISLIALKYTQSNSVCYVKDGQAIGIGAGQQSRIHCTRLAGNKADIWYLRQHQKVLNLPFKKDIRRADRDNTIDVYISDDYMDVLADGIWENFFTEKPEPLTREEKRAWLDTLTGVSLGSDAFFPFGDNIERAHRSGVQYIAEPGGSIRDDNVIETCDKYNMVLAFTGIRLFHH